MLKQKLNELTCTLTNTYFDKTDRSQDIIGQFSEKYSFQTRKFVSVRTLGDSTDWVWECG